MIDRVALIADLRAQAINLRAALDNTLRLIRLLEDSNGDTPPPLAAAPAADPPFRRGRPKANGERDRLIRESLLSGTPAPLVSRTLQASLSHVYRIKREVEQAHGPLKPPAPAEPPPVFLSFAERTAQRIEGYIASHGPTAYSPLIQALDITPRLFNEALPHVTQVEKIDGLWQEKPRIVDRAVVSE